MAIIQGRYLSSPPSPTAGEIVELQTDSAGKLLISGTITADVTQTLDSVTPTHSSVTAGAASSTMLASNASRKTVIVTNTHATNRVTLKFGATAVLDTGITIMPGGAYSMGQLDYYNGQIDCIASGASTVLSIVEF